MAALNEALAFVQDPNTPKLGVAINGKSVGGGKHVPKAETHTTPILTLPSPSGTYIALCIDLDAPFMSFPFLSPILHWMQPGLHATSSSSSSEPAELSASGVPFVVDYRGAGPPPGAAPHRYIFLLYEQPEGFDGKKFGQPEEGSNFGMIGRMRWSLDMFSKEAGLGKVVAGEWFVSN